MSKVNPQELIVIHKKDLETIQKLTILARGIQTYDLNRFREEAYDVGYMICDVFVPKLKEKYKTEFLTKEIELP